MKFFIMILAVVLVVACGSDVTGPTGPEEPPIYQITYKASVTFELGYLSESRIEYTESGAPRSLDTLMYSWEHSFEAILGDSLYICCWNFTATDINVSIWIDGQFETSGNNWGSSHASCSSRL